MFRTTQNNDYVFAAFITGMGGAYYGYMKNHLPKEALRVHTFGIGLFGVSQIAFKGSPWRTEFPATFFLGLALRHQIQTLSKTIALSALLFGGTLLYGAHRYHGSEVSATALELEEELQDLDNLSKTETDVRALIERFEACLKNPRLSKERRIGLGNAFYAKLQTLRLLVDHERLSNVVLYMEHSQQDRISKGLGLIVAQEVIKELGGLETSEGAETHAKELIERFEACLKDPKLSEKGRMDLEHAFLEKISQLHAVVRDNEVLTKVIVQMEAYQQEAWVALDKCPGTPDYSNQLFAHMEQTQQRIVLEVIEYLLEKEMDEYTSQIQMWLQNWRTEIYNPDDEEDFFYEILRVACDLHKGFALTFSQRTDADPQYWPIRAILYDKKCIELVPGEDPFQDLLSKPENDEMIEKVCEQIFSEHLFPFVGTLLAKITDPLLKEKVFKENFEDYFTGDDAIDPKWILQWWEEAGLVTAD